MYYLLLVDDEKMERDCIKHLVNKHFSNIDIIESKNGQDAIDIVKKNHIDIIITDVKMPYMDGLTFLKEVSTIDKNIKTIVYSAFSEFEYAKKAIKYGVIEYLLKPVDVNEFINVFTSVMTTLEHQSDENSHNEELFNPITTSEFEVDDSISNQKKIMDNIYNAVKARNNEGVCVNIDKLFYILERTNNLSSLYVRHLCIEILEMSMDIAYVSKDKILKVVEHIGQVSNVASLRDVIKNYLLQIIMEYNLYSPSKNVNIIDRVIDIIKKEYKNGISLEEIAERIYFSPTYISALFKKEKGINFVKFLNDYRLEQAKIMLDTTEMKISDICKENGFASDSYFISQFRKTYGVTPTQYREGKI